MCLLENDCIGTDPQRITEITNEFFLSVGNQALTDHMDISYDSHSFINHIIEKYKAHNSIANIKRN